MCEMLARQKKSTKCECSIIIMYSANYTKTHIYFLHKISIYCCFYIFYKIHDLQNDKHVYSEQNLQHNYFWQKKQKIKTGNQTTREPGLCLSLCMLRPLCPRLISYISFHRILSGRPPHTQTPLGHPALYSPFSQVSSLPTYSNSRYLSPIIK